MGLPRTVAALIFLAATAGAIEPVVVSTSTVLQPVPIREETDTKQDKITFATRAPHAKDKGSIWIQYTENSDTTISIWVRHPKSGTWRKVDAT